MKKLLQISTIIVVFAAQHTFCASQQRSISFPCLHEETTRTYPLHQAVRSRNLPEVQKIIAKQEVRINAHDLPINNGDTPLHIAAENGDTPIMECLIEAGADVNATNNIGKQTPLTLAARNGHAAAAQCLLAHNADVNLCSIINSPLHMAVLSNNKSLVNIVLDSKADINAKDFRGKTALHYAASHGYIEIAQELIQRAALINAQDKNEQTALHDAIINKQPTVADYLLTITGINTTITDKYGKTALDYR